MILERGVRAYARDIIYGATSYPSGWFRPDVVIGHFTQDQKGAYQQIFFDELLRIEFQRTAWQLVFPGQTAGLVKKIPEQSDGTNEYHIRFYNDGIIDCELEVHRFGSMHWIAARRHGVQLLDWSCAVFRHPLSQGCEILKISRQDFLRFLDIPARKAKLYFLDMLVQ